MNNLKIDELFTMICEVLDEHLTHPLTNTSNTINRNEVHES